MNFLLFLCFVVTVQETLYSLAGLSGAALFFMRALVDVSSILLIVFFAARRTLLGSPVPLSGIGFERFFFIFFAYSLAISIAVTSSNLAVNISEILVLNRFIFLAMAVPFLVNTEEKIERVLRFVWILVLVQLCLGVVQLLGGQSVIRFFAPSDYTNAFSGVERSFTTNRELARDFLIGSLGDFVSFGYILLFGILIYISRQAHGLRAAIILSIFLAVIFMTGSRTIFVVAFLTTSLYWLRKKTIAVRALFVVFALPLFPALFIFVAAAASSAEFEYSNFLSLFTPEIIDHLLNQRLGMLLFYVPSFLGDPAVLTGLSPDKVFIAGYVRENFDQLPYILLYYFDSLLEDVYPVAILSYYGIFGMFLFYMMQLRIFLQARRTLNSDSAILSRMSHLLVLAFPVINLLSLANQSFENRGAAFLLWLFVGLYASALNLHAARTRERQATDIDDRAS